MNNKDYLQYSGPEVTNVLTREHTGLLYYNYIKIIKDKLL